jgi:WD40 repeat protein
VFRLLIAAGLSAAGLAAPVPKADPTRDRDGYSLPAGAIARLGSLHLRGPTTHGVTFSADGKTLLAADDTHIYLWDADTGRRLPDRPARPTGAHARGFDSLVAGPRLVRLSNRTLRAAKQEVLVTWVADGKQEVRFEADARGAFDVRPLQLGPAAVSADGSHLALADPGSDTLSVYALASGKRLQTHKVVKTYGLGVYISPDGQTLFAREPDRLSVRRWELASGKELPALVTDGGGVNMIEVSADGRRAVTRGARTHKSPGGIVSVRDDEYLTVWDLTTAKPTGRLEVGGRPWHFRFAGPAALLVGTWKQDPPAPWTAALSRWDLTRGRKEWEVPAPYSYGWMAVSPDGRRFAVSNRQHVMYLFDAATGKPTVAPPGHPGLVQHVAFSADGKAVTTISSEDVRVWSADGTPKAVAVPPELRRGWFPPAPFGDRIVWVTYREDKSPEVVFWDPERAAVGWRFRWDGGPIDRILAHAGDTRVVVIARDGEAQRTWTVSVYDGPTGKKLHEWPIADPPQVANGWCPTVALSPRGTLLHAAGPKVVERSLADGEPARELDVPPLERLSSSNLPPPLTVSRDGARVAVVETQTVRVIDLKTGKRLTDDRLAERMYGGEATFSPDGSRLAVWSAWGTWVRVYDVATGRKPRVLEGGYAVPTAAAFSPDGSRLAVGYRDGTGLVWDLTAK